jgi:hypothetical protein
MPSKSPDPITPPPITTPPAMAASSITAVLLSDTSFSSSDTSDAAMLELEFGLATPARIFHTRLPFTDLRLSAGRE